MHFYPTYLELLITYWYMEIMEYWKKCMYVVLHIMHYKSYATENSILMAET